MERERGGGKTREHNIDCLILSLLCFFFLSSFPSRMAAARVRAFVWPDWALYWSPMEYKWAPHRVTANGGLPRKGALGSRGINLYQFIPILSCYRGWRRKCCDIFRTARKLNWQAFIWMVSLFLGHACLYCCMSGSVTANFSDIFITEISQNVRILSECYNRRMVQNFRSHYSKKGSNPTDCFCSSRCGPESVFY